jgi:hypothetical protein
MKIRLALACVAIVLGLSFTVADASTGREYPIGTINYEAQPEREVINVRRGEGAFRGIRLEVRQSDVEIRDLRVTYDDGSSDVIRVGQLVRAGGSTRELTLETAKELRAALDRAIAAADFEEAQLRGKGAMPRLVRVA